MMHELYLFGSVVRGEVSANSDVDILVVPEAAQMNDNYPPTWSVYNKGTLKDYFEEGRLFAWHLHLEAKCIYSPHDRNWLEVLDKPAPYRTAGQDVDILTELLMDSLLEIRSGTSNLIYEVGITYTAIRDIAMSAAWCVNGTPNFSRRAPYLLSPACPVPETMYNHAMAARFSSTRGGAPPDNIEAVAHDLIVAPLKHWIDDLRKLL